MTGKVLPVAITSPLRGAVSVLSLLKEWSDKVQVPFLQINTATSKNFKFAKA